MSSVIINPYQFAVFVPFTNGPSITRATVGTSASIDTSGMDLLVAVVSGYDISGTISDSKSNTWTALTDYNGGGSNHAKIYYCKSPTVGAGHTFTLGAAAYASMVVASFAGAHLTSPFDQENGNHSASGTTVQAGSITPTVNNTLIIAGIELGGSNYSSIDSGFTLVAKEDFAFGVNVGTAMAYKVQSAAAAVNPQWTTSASAANTAAIANFKPA